MCTWFEVRNFASQKIRLTPALLRTQESVHSVENCARIL